MYAFKKIQNFYIKLRIQFNRFVNFYYINFYSKIEGDISKKFKESLSELRLNGITKLPIKLDSLERLDIKDFILKRKISFEDSIIVKKYLNAYPNKYGVMQGLIDTNSLIIRDLFTKDLFLLIKNYYGRDFWVRNAPVLIAHLKKSRIEEYTQKLFHIDHAERQLSIMVFLDDVTEDSTHMEYIKKSQKNSWLFKSVVREDYNFKKKVNDELEKKEVFKMIGKKGDIFIFDAGNGIHRAVYGNDRIVLHFNFAQMRSYAEFNDNYEKNQNINNLTDYRWNFFFNNEMKHKLKLNLFEGKNLKWSRSK